MNMDSKPHEEREEKRKKKRKKTKPFQNGPRKPDID
jgi:hypothetical protein